MEGLGLEDLSVDDKTENLARLRNPLNVQDLLSTEGAMFEVNFEELEDEKKPDQYNYDNEDLLKHVNPNCLDLEDEDGYDDGEPFEKLAKKMEKITKDGGIKKRILREGYGPVVPEKSLATIHYNAYIEYNEEPYDSTYLRNRPHTFRLNHGAVLPGLEMSVLSMKLNERSQFLIEPKYAFGKVGCLERVPPDATILFEIELKNFVDSGAIGTYSALSEDKKQDFDEIYKYANALSCKAKDLFKKGLIKAAIKEYNIAASTLETSDSRNYEDQAKQQELMLRLLGNLVVAYTKIDEPKRACANCNKIYNMCKGTNLDIPAKVYFNHARSLIVLGNFEEAEEKLKQAQKLEPQNNAITKEILKLEDKKKEQYNKDCNLAKSIFQKY